MTVRYPDPAGPWGGKTSCGPVVPDNAGSDDVDVRRAGKATMLGRNVDIVELRPAWRSSSTRTTTPGFNDDALLPRTGDDADDAGGVIRVFIDPERMFVMRWEVDNGDGRGSSIAEITALHYGTEIDDESY